MSNRYLVGGGALLLAVAAALWYTVLEPSSGHLVDPGGDAIVVSAAQAGSGSWVRYTVTVANAGRLDFDGSVSLRNRGSEAAGGIAVPGPGQVPGAAAAAGKGRFPSVAPDAAYQVHVRVPAGRQRVLSMTTPERYSMVEAQDARGRLLNSGPVEANVTTPVAVLSDNGAVADAVAQVQVGEFAIRVLNLGGAKTFPSSATQLSGIAAVVVDNFETGSLSRPQLATLRDFVGLGGSLVVAGGADWRRTLAGLPPELSPLRGRSTTGANLGAAASLGNLVGDFSAPIVSGDLSPGARVVIGSPDAPLLIELGFGSGRVVMVTFDPAAEPVVSSKLAALAWGQAVTRAFNRGPGTPPAASALPGPAPIPDDLFAAPVDPPLPSPLIVGGVLLGYLMLVGPVNLLLSRRLNKPDLLWITTPLIAVVATGSFWGVGMATQGGNRDDLVQVVKAAPSGTAAKLEFHRILFHQRGNHNLTLGAGSLPAPLTLPLYLATGSDCTRCVLQLTGLPQNVEEHVINSVPPVVSESGVAYGNVRMVGSLTLERQTVGIDAHLQARGGEISGTIRNLGAATVRQLSLYSFDGEVVHRVHLSDELGPGRIQQVRGVPAQAESDDSNAHAPVRVGRDQLLANSLARSAMNWDPRPLLIGTTEAAPSQLLVDGHPESTTARGFIEQPVRIESADSLLRDFQQVRLASHTGDARAGYLNVYDLELPRQVSGPLKLAVDKSRISTFELYDWASGGWGQGTWPDDPTNAARTLVSVQPSQFSEGLVRYRIREPRTSWGSFVTTTPAT